MLQPHLTTRWISLDWGLVVMSFVGNVLFHFSFPEEIWIIYQLPDPIHLLYEIASASFLLSQCPDVFAWTWPNALRNSLSPWSFFLDCQKIGFNFLSHSSYILVCNVICIKYILDYPKFLLAYIGEDILVMNNEVYFPGHTTFVPRKTL